jgi:hypothetical protein
MGGLSMGINASSNGGDFWDGDKMTFDQLAPNQGAGRIARSYQEGENMSYDQNFTDGFAKKNMDFGVDDHVSNLYGDGSVPDGYTKSGDAVYNPRGKEVFGTTIYHRGGDDVYLYKGAYVSKDQLYETMLHEYIHAGFDHNGYIGYTSENEHASIYKYQYEQASKWGDIDLKKYYEGWMNYYSGSFNESYYNLIESQLHFYQINTSPILP